MIEELVEMYTCQYCNHSFTKEKTLAVHVCEQKRRHLSKDEKHVQIGFQTFVRFYQLTQNRQGTKTYKEFTHSPYYNAFVKFGSFVSNINPLYPEKFIDFIITSGVKLDHWCKDELYDEYVIDLIRSESVETALERSIKYMTKWADENDSVWNHYFNYVNTNRAMFDIKDGKISPWLTLQARSGRDLLSKFNDEQLTYVNPIINPDFWIKKFKKHTADVHFIKKIIEESQL
jgi:hypothetical protein